MRVGLALQEFRAVKRKKKIEINNFEFNKYQSSRVVNKKYLIEVLMSE